MQFERIESFCDSTTRFGNLRQRLGLRHTCVERRCDMAKVVAKKSAKRKVKKGSKGIKEMPEVAYDEEEDETITSEEEEEEKDGEDERRHQKLLEAISSLGGERGTRVRLQGLGPGQVLVQGPGRGSCSRVLVQVRSWLRVQGPAPGPDSTRFNETKIRYFDVNVILMLTSLEPFSINECLH